MRHQLQVRVASVIKIPCIGAYTLPSIFDAHPPVTVRRSPRMTFRRRDGWEKMYISADHLRERIGRGTPGPGSFPSFHGLSDNPGARFNRAVRPRDIRFFPSPKQATPGYVYDQSSPIPFPHARVSSFPRSARALHDPPTVPLVGPGSYTPSPTSHLNRLSFGASFDSYRSLSCPGLDREKKGRGSWTIASHNPRFSTGSSRVSFTREKRKNWFDETVKRNPTGPGLWTLEPNSNGPKFRRPSKCKPRLQYKRSCG
jgi:hypothetical protein